MSDSIEIKVNGLEQLYANLANFSDKEVLAATRDGLQAVGDLWADAARDLAPDGDSGMLKASIGHVVKMSPSKGWGVVRVGPMFGLGKVKPNDRTSDPAIYGAFVEWGHRVVIKAVTWLGTTKYKQHRKDGVDVVVPGKRFLTPVFDTMSETAIDTFIATVKARLGL